MLSSTCSLHRFHWRDHISVLWPLTQTRSTWPSSFSDNAIQRQCHLIRNWSTLHNAMWQLHPRVSGLFGLLYMLSRLLYDSCYAVWCLSRRSARRPETRAVLRADSVETISAGLPWVWWFPWVWLWGGYGDCYQSYGDSSMGIFAYMWDSVETL